MLEFIVVIFLISGVFYFVYDTTSELGARAASHGENVHLAGVASNALDALTRTPGTPPEWCAQGLAPAHLGLAPANETNLIDACKLASLRASQNTPAGLAALRTSLGLPATGSPQHFHLRVTPHATADGAGNVSALANMTVLYVGHATGRVDAPENLAERAALSTLHLAYTPNAIDTTGSLVAGDDANDTPAVLSRYVPPRLAGFDFAQDDASLVGSDGTYWRILNATTASSDIPCGRANPSLFGSDPPYAHVATLAHCDGAGNWRIDANATLRSFRLIALVNLTPFAKQDPWLTFTYHFDSSGSANAARIEACAWPCSPVGWVTLDTLPTANAGDVKLAHFATRSVPLHTYAVAREARVYLSFTYIVRSSQIEPTAGFFFADPHVNATGPMFADWMDFDSNRTLGALLIGTNVHQDALADPVLDRAIADYANASGTLIALGSTSLSTSWLNALTAPTPITSASAPLTTGGDATHPVFHEPFTLTLPAIALSSSGYTSVPTWNAVLLSDTRDAKGARVPTLQTSLPALGRSGTTILTSFTPGSSASLTNDDRAHLFANFLLEGRLRTAFIDYGDTIPRVTTVAQATRILTVTLDPTTNEAVVPTSVRITIYVW
ncbi:MAG: hypothetical protein ACYDCK_02825 [Thermoplasmatota archaeon]